MESEMGGFHPSSEEVVVTEAQGYTDVRCIVLWPNEITSY